MYKIFNPYRHLTESFTLATEEIERIKASMTTAQRNSLEAGHGIKLGASVVWKV